MKSNKTFKISLSNVLIALPMILLFVALIVLACAGFNKTIDYKTYYQFDVKFNTTITKDQQTSYQARFDKLADKNNIDMYSADLINEGVTSGLQVKVFVPSNLTESEALAKVEAMQTDIKAITDINTDAVIVIENNVKVLPNQWGSALLAGSVTISVLAIIAFLYIWFRWEIRTALVYMISLCMGEFMTLSLIAILRLPVGLQFMTPYYVTAFAITVLFALIFTKIRANNTADNVTNADLLRQSLRDTRHITTTLVIALGSAILLSAIAFTLPSFSNLAQCLFALVSAIYVLLAITLPVWCLVYNRKNDLRLIQRQQRAKEKEEDKKKGVKKDNDKLVV